MTTLATDWATAPEHSVSDGSRAGRRRAWCLLPLRGSPQSDPGDVAGTRFGGLSTPGTAPPTNGYRTPQAASPTLQALYRQLEDLERDLLEHIRKENDILFPRVQEME